MSDDEPLVLPLVVVPHIYEPVSVQPIDTKNYYKYLAELELADSGVVGSNLEIDILIGSDYYWDLVTGRVVKGDGGGGGATAIETRFGWTVNLVSSSHMLRVAIVAESEGLETELKRFWNLESLGISKEEHPVQQQFTQHIMFDMRYAYPGKNLTLTCLTTTTTCAKGA